MTFSVPKSIYEWSLRIIDLIGNIILDYLKKTVHNILTITTDIQGGGLWKKSSQVFKENSWNIPKKKFILI